MRAGGGELGPRPAAAASSAGRGRGRAAGPARGLARPWGKGGGVWCGVGVVHGGCGEQLGKPGWISGVEGAGDLSP